MGWREDYISLLQGFGVDVEIRPGWMQQSAGRGNWTKGQPVGQINHHFANNAASSDLGLVRMLEDGYVGSPKPFVVNDFLGRDGKLFLISSYPTGHPGKGSAQVMNRILASQAPLGDAAAVGMPDDYPQQSAERLLYGVEVSNPGDGTPFRPGQYRALVARNAALAIACRLSSNVSIQHREWTRRKPDINRATCNANQLRADVAALMAGKSQPKPPVPDKPAKDWFDMASPEELAVIVQKAFENGNNQAAFGRAVLATNTGTKDAEGKEQSLAGQLAAIMGRLQAIEALLPKA
jgi:hypothetical protein